MADELMKHFFFVVYGTYIVSTQCALMQFPIAKAFDQHCNWQRRGANMADKLQSFSVTYMAPTACSLAFVPYAFTRGQRLGPALVLQLTETGTQDPRWPTSDAHFSLLSVESMQCALCTFPWSRLLPSTSTVTG